jgi:hypothetical protein
MSITGRSACRRGYEGLRHRVVTCGFTCIAIGQGGEVSAKLRVVRLRELALYHDKRASGAAAIAPKDAARFQAGAGASEPSDDELRALAAKAGSAADHHALEEYFATAAKRYRDEANQHNAMAQAYRGTRIAQAAVHCDRLVTLSRDEAKEATAAAEMHKQLAIVARRRHSDRWRTQRRDPSSTSAHDGR